ncbi:MAG: hypothetical protein ACRDKI_08080 [Solirubrobacterales bacterium]
MSWRTRAFTVFALLCAGELAVHDLRYWIGIGAGPGSTGVHAYLAIGDAVVGMLLLAAITLFGRRLYRALTGRYADAIPNSGFFSIWAAFTAILTTTFVLQESFEGIAAGAGTGSAPLIAQNGWIAPLLAAIVAALIALVVRAGEQLVRLAGDRTRRRWAALVEFSGRVAPLPRLRSVIARNLAGRAPPLAV